MNFVFLDMLRKFVIVYLDDILIYSGNLQQHVVHVRLVLRCLLDHGLYVKAKKCECHKTELTFLSYHTGPVGVGMEENKVSAVSEWPQPTSVKQLQRFLGFAYFYCRFICSFCAVAAPLTNLLKGKLKRLKIMPEIHF